MKKVILTSPPHRSSIIFEDNAPSDLNDTLRVKMLTNIVHFSYQKKDGSLREAFGTLQADKITTPVGEGKPNEAIGTYFDLEANAWRSYVVANLVAIY